MRKILVKNHIQVNVPSSVTDCKQGDGVAATLHAQQNCHYEIKYQNDGYNVHKSY